jgi:hypothetical protein
VEPALVEVDVICSGLDAEGVTELAHNLRDIILTLDVDGADLKTASPAPVGAKSGGLVAVGAIVVALAPTVLEGLVGVVASWLSRQPGDVEVEIDGHRFRGQVTKAQRDELVAAYLRRLGTTS